MSYFQKDINTLQALDLPDTFNKEGDLLRVKTDGSGDTEWFDPDTGIINIGTGLFSDGTQLNPSISFRNDNDLGIIRAGSNHLRVVANNSILADFNTTHFRSRLPLHSEIGSVSAPTYSFDLDPDTGIYRKGANNLSITTGGIDKLDIKQTETDFRQTSNFRNNTNVTQLTNIINDLTAGSGIANSQNWTSVAFDGARYRAVCPALISNNFAQSIDGGLTWTIFSSNVSWGNPNFIIWFSSRWYAFTSVPFSQYLLNTTTGTTSGWAFTSYTGTPGGNITLTLAKVVNNQLLVTTTTGVLRVTTDGTNWTQQTAAIATNKSIVDIAYNSVRTNLYVAVANNGGIFYATGTSIVAGTTWTSVASVSSINFRSVIYSPKLDLFVAFQLDSPYSIYASRDGINWDTSMTLEPIGIFTPAYGIWIDDYNGFFLVGQNDADQMLVSRDGMTWSIVTNNINVRPSSFFYQQPIQRLVLVGQHATGVNISAFSVFSTNAPNPIFLKNITNIETIIDYSHTNINNGFFSIDAFASSCINCNTSNGNTQIMLLGATIPLNNGLKYKIRKFDSTNNNVQISTTETTRLLNAETIRLVNPITGGVATITTTTTPIDIIPSSYFGSFDLTLLDNTGNKIWLIDNLEIFSNFGVERKLKDISINGALSVESTLIHPIEDNRNFTAVSIGGVDYAVNVDLSNIPNLGKFNYINSPVGTNCFIELYPLNASYNNYTVYFVGDCDNSGVAFAVRNNLGVGSNSVDLYVNGAVQTINNGANVVLDPHQYIKCTYKHQYRLRGGATRNFWLVHNHNSNN